MSESNDLYKLDQRYSDSRRALFQKVDWIFGPLNRMHTIDHIIRSKDAEVIGNRFCEIGCGINNPAGASAILFMNGASLAVGFDLNEPSDMRRSAEALYDVVIRCISEPDVFHFSGISRTEFLARAGQFDLKRLLDGDLYGGLINTDARFVVASIYNLDPKLFVDFDVTYSRAVLEHIPEFFDGCKVMCDITAVGGVGFHVIDFVDHRFYKDPDHFNAWSFLCEGAKYQVGTPAEDVSNRLRPSEVRKCFEIAGFKTDEFFRTSSVMPKDVRARLDQRFRHLSTEELEACQIGYRIEKLQGQVPNARQLSGAKRSWSP